MLGPTARAAVSLALPTVLSCSRLPGGLGRAAHALVGGTWMGLLSEQQLRALDARYYDGAEMYRTAAWNGRGLTWWERAAIDAAFAPGGRIAVVGSGGGREVLALRVAGFDAVGYEAHPGLATFAEGFLAERGHPGCSRRIEHDRFPAGERWDGVLVGWGAYSLIAPRTRRRAFLRDAVAATVSRGAVVVSVFEQSPTSRDLRLATAVADRVRRLRGATPVELGDVLAPNRVHVFTATSLAQELSEAGLRVEQHHTVAPATPRIAYACAIGRRP